MQKYACSDRSDKSAPTFGCDENKFDFEEAKDNFLEKAIAKGSPTYPKPTTPILKVNSINFYCKPQMMMSPLYLVLFEK